MDNTGFLHVSVISIKKTQGNSKFSSVRCYNLARDKKRRNF